jgi:hypothetical protein
MEQNDREAAFLALVTDPENPIDVATAYAATSDPEVTTAVDKRAHTIGIIAALIVSLVLLYLFI